VRLRVGKKIETLIDRFHEKGSVHGDLCLANFVITAGDLSLQEISLIDFDWGGGGDVTS